MPSASPASSVGAILNHAYSMMGPSLGATSEGMLCIPLNTLAAWPPGNLPASWPLPRSCFLMFGGTHECKLLSFVPWLIL